MRHRVLVVAGELRQVAVRRCGAWCGSLRSQHACNLVGARGHAVSVDLEDLSQITRNFQDAAVAAIAGMGGTIATVTPDEILALFGYPKAHEDDAERAVDAVAQSAPMALQRITDAGNRSLILILSDINMPGMSGLELLPKAKAARPDVPIIMITAYGDAETKRRALESGAEALLTKPIDFGTLRSEIDMRVERAA